MIFSIPFKMIQNVNNDLQISVAKDCQPGQRIVSETLQEKPKDKHGKDLFVVHPTKPWLMSASDNYVLMQGGLKVWFRWKEGDPFSKENVEDYIAFQETLIPTFRSDVDLVIGDDYVQGTYTHSPTTTTGFTETTYHSWQPYTSEVGVEITSTETVFICPMQYEAGWTFKTADLMNNDSLTVDREGKSCYVLPGQLLHTEDGKRVEKYKLTKLESGSVKLINRSGTFCKIAKMFR